MHSHQSAHQPIPASTPTNSHSQPEHSHAPQAAQAPADRRPTGPSRKLDAEVKERICLLVARGHSLTATARMLGVSERTIYRERQRDPIFRCRLNEKREDIADLCFQSLRAAATEKAYAAIQLYKLIYPERVHYKPDTITRKQYEAWTTEIIALFNSIATDEQMEKLNRMIQKAKYAT